MDALTGLAALQRLYEGARPRPWLPFPDQALDALDIGVDAGSDADLDRVPATGPLVVVANHPHGALDGLALASLLRWIRSDVKLLGNRLLDRIPEMRDSVVPVDSFRPAGAHNAGGVRAALAWLRDGHVLVVFPAGEVSHLRAADGRIVDASWRDGAARLAAHAEAPVLPLFVHGHNSRWFRRAGLVSPWLRSALLGRELLARRGTVVRVAIGRPVSARRLAGVGDAAAQTAYLRVRTYGLATPTAARGSLLRGATRPPRPEPVADPVAPRALADEIAALPARSTLLSASPWRVYCVAADEAPLALQEIGQLRERTFRAAGEGTGRATDLDDFDRHYRHLFVWHEERQQIAGAYRLAATDDVLPRRGLHGLYTRTLFRYSTALLRDLGPALELGRSFVRAEYQRDYQPLLLLWRGIGALVAANPRYRTLFGPVSISAEYGPTTRQLLARVLLASRGSLLQSFVVPRRPLPEPADGTDALVHSRVAATLQEVDALVRDLESDQRGLPVLLRHYLKLNAKLLGFSVDPAFGGVLDGLVVVDLLDVDRALLARYLGKDAARAFVAAHERGRELETAGLCVGRSFSSASGQP
ncbi:MAG: lysophospholipid acyltransferase family protein [Dehalococcoidia bacterium]